MQRKEGRRGIYEHQLHSQCGCVWCFGKLYKRVGDPLMGASLDPQRPLQAGSQMGPGRYCIGVRFLTEYYPSSHDSWRLERLAADPSRTKKAFRPSSRRRPWRHSARYTAKWIKHEGSAYEQMYISTLILSRCLP